MNVTSCSFHPAADAASTCEDCRASLCDACTQSALGRTWCAPCLERRIGAAASAPPPPPVAGRVKLRWLAFCLTFLPGLGQLYNGFIARGLAQFAAWWLLFVTIDALHAGQFLFFVAWLAFWFWCAMDAMRTAGMLNRRGYGATREEARSITIGPATESQVRFAGVALVVVGCLLFASQLGAVVSTIARFVLPLGLIGAGWWVLHRARLREARERAEAAGGVTA